MTTTYETALKTANEASATYTIACDAYRAKRIDDATFLKARVIYMESVAVFDNAYSVEEELIETAACPSSL